jgi:hypothetical protein
MTKFYNVRIDELTDAECRELLVKIESLVNDMPSFIEYDRDGGYGRIYDPYSCCSGDTKFGHDEDCSIGNLKIIFRY